MQRWKPRKSNFATVLPTINAFIYLSNHFVSNVEQNYYRQYSYIILLPLLPSPSFLSFTYLFIYLFSFLLLFLLLSSLVIQHFKLKLRIKVTVLLKQLSASYCHFFFGGGDSNKTEKELFSTVADILKDLSRKIKVFVEMKENINLETATTTAASFDK